MAVILPNPDNVPGQVTTGYQRQNTVLYASMVGFCNINLNGNNVGAGSVFEVNGALFRCMNNESIQGLTGISNSTFFYIYAEPVNNTNIQFYARADAPAWNTEKAGYYINNNRALIKAIKQSNGNVEAVKMNSILTNVNSVVPANSGGAQVFNKSVRTHESYHGQAGWYRYEICSGSGAGDGAGYTPGPNNNYRTGAGSGAGEETYIISGAQKISTDTVKPGDGGGVEAGLGVTGTVGIPYSVNPGVSARTRGGGFGGDPGTGSGSVQHGVPTLYNNISGVFYHSGGAIIVHVGGNGYGGNTVAGFGGAPGWTRPLGDTAAGYCRLFYIGV